MKDAPHGNSMLAFFKSALESYTGYQEQNYGRRQSHHRRGTSVMCCPKPACSHSPEAAANQVPRLLRRGEHQPNETTDAAEHRAES
jgi:hypothetical protein